MLKLGVVEPLRVKTQAIQSAAEAAVMIIRIDDVIASKKSGGPGGMPGAGGGGPGDARRNGRRGLRLSPHPLFRFPFFFRQSILCSSSFSRTRNILVL